jgi:penicillin-binding protein 2
MRLFRRKKQAQIDFDEILVDATNLPSWNKGRLEGRLEIPISPRAMHAIGIAFSLILVVFGAQLVRLQIVEGEEYAQRSANNHFNQSVIFAERGVIYDREGERLAWNAEGERNRDFAERVYTDRRGLGQVLGYVNYPRKDASGFYFRTEYVGRGGSEGAFDEDLRGQNGEQLIEVDALGNVISEHVVHDPESGREVRLTLSASLSEALYDHIATSAARVDFRSGAGAIMDVETGEIIAMASYPAFDPEMMTKGDADAIDAYDQDDRLPFLNKIISGIYTPGSIVKPFVALGALAEDIISPEKTIVSTGALTVPNPYNPSAPTIFRD